MEENNTAGWSWAIELHFAQTEIQELESQLAGLREYEAFCLLALANDDSGETI